jgi:hypothetical protein
MEIKDKSSLMMSEGLEELLGVAESDGLAQLVLSIAIQSLKTNVQDVSLSVDVLTFEHNNCPNHELMVTGLSCSDYINLVNLAKTNLTSNGPKCVFALSSGKTKYSWTSYIRGSAVVILPALGKRVIKITC